MKYNSMTDGQQNIYHLIITVVLLYYNKIRRLIGLILMKIMNKKV